MNGAIPDGCVLHLPAKAVPHKFGDPVSVPADKSPSGHQQTERSCTLCGAVKVTVHGLGDNQYRAWRKSANAEQIETFAAPLCEPQP